MREEEEEPFLYIFREGNNKGGYLSLPFSRVLSIREETWFLHQEKGKEGKDHACWTRPFLVQPSSCLYLSRKSFSFI